MMNVTDSMLVYLSTFSISLLGIKIADIMSKGRSKGVGYYKNELLNKFLVGLILLISCCIPCVLAALRAETVGVDIVVYVTPSFNQALKSDMTFLKFLNTSGVEILFSIITYITAKIANIQVLFFIIEILIIGPIMILLYNNRATSSMTFGMAVYYLLFFNISLCLMRQSISMAILLLAYDYLSKNKLKKTIILAVVACLFHNSAIIIIIIYFIVYYISKMQHSKKMYMLLFGILAIIFLCYHQIASLLAKMVAMVSTRYAYYINIYLNDRNWAQIPSTDFLCKGMLVATTCIVLKLSKKLNEKNRTLFIMTLIGRYFVLFNANFYESMRMAFYFDYFLILFIPQAMSAFKANVENWIFTRIIYLLPAFLYWYYYIMHIGAYGTEIYKFFWD